MSSVEIPTIQLIEYDPQLHFRSEPIGGAGFGWSGRPRLPSTALQDAAVSPPGLPLQTVRAAREPIVASGSAPGLQVSLLSVARAQGVSDRTAPKILRNVRGPPFGRPLASRATLFSFKHLDGSGRGFGHRIHGSCGQWRNEICIEYYTSFVT